MLLRKGLLAKSVLLTMVEFAQADGPLVGRFEARASVSAGADVRALDRFAAAAAD